MKKIILFFLLLFVQQYYCSAQEIDMSSDSVSVDSFYIPHGMKKCISELDSIHDIEMQQEILLMNEDEYVEIATNGLGTWLRNNWDTWRGYCLSDYFSNKAWKGTENIAETLARYYYRYLKTRYIYMI